ncbi:hypothetical protein N7468_005403 [Penicillium chermesinum]|uniref:SAP domain-containing protein n=1 Tax=Penicillium chermesinum TaxID=63820 RepID=A0A9W9TN62_9EURO|nr:uncharacterized protein N7468_005403 [Penicillium chermesinum]KAJ5232447.1 hypothetical protein N7468_005403 [Penicillium chermesinum]
MRVTHAFRLPPTPSSLQWLAPLKSAQLQHVARATGIQSSGTKAALLERIQAGLANRAPPRNPGPDTHRSRDDWSILSIDMGIQNLAFAHLRVPNPRASHHGDGFRDSALPELTAWRRLAVSEISSLDLVTETDPASAIPLFAALSHAPERKSADAFSPDIYAVNAYTLITTLLANYKPTHVLIERQRFRSSGGSAVQEWTLRVGVFEGMLYAILHALRQERGGDLTGVQVHGIEPKRVARYWTEIDGVGVSDPDQSEKRKVSAREVKKAKIDLVGRWLTSSLHLKENNESVSSPETDFETMPVMNSDRVGQRKLSLGPGSSVELLANAYVQKWQKQNGKKKRSSAAAKASDIGKLDDLADCLLQGVTWVEWQVMREKLAREGYEALDRLA